MVFALVLESRIRCSSESLIKAFAHRQSSIRQRRNHSKSRYHRVYCPAAYRTYSPPTISTAQCLEKIPGYHRCPPPGDSVVTVAAPGPARTMSLRTRKHESHRATPDRQSECQPQACSGADSDGPAKPARAFRSGLGCLRVRAPGLARPGAVRPEAAPAGPPPPGHWHHERVGS